MATAAGIVLAGGRSSRMGTPKAALEWHGSTLLRRIVGLVERGVDGPVVVVRAPGQVLPALPASVEVVEDAREGRGPLQGLAAGLAALDGRVEVAYASSTDAPLLHPAFVRRVVGALDADADVDVVLPRAGGFPHPLAAAYRTTLRPLVERLLAEDRLRPAFLFDECRVLRLDEDALLADPALARADPALDSVLNLNEPADYKAARARPAPEIAVQRFGPLARNGGTGPQTMRAATLGTAAHAAGVTLDEHVVAALNGDQISRDPELPLAAGDIVAFMAADAGG
jgi:molybdenum cofactor guanylyltransferase